jgi:putrescine transport system substrate-binding protein
MTKFSGRIAVAAALLAGSALSAFAADKEIHVYNWSNYIDDSILQDFTKETGIKVVYDVYDAMETLEAKMFAGRSGYDIVVPTDRNMQVMLEAGIFQPLDKAKIPNLKYNWPEIYQRLATYDPDNAHAVNYMWGTTGLGYDKVKIDKAMPNAPVDSMAMIFDPEVAAKFKDCGIYVLNSAEDVMPAALNYLGLDPNSKNVEDFQKAADLLMKVRPYIRKFDSSLINPLATGEACLVFSYSGDILQARDAAKEGVDVKYSIPKEGALLWMDSMVVPKDAPNPEGAFAFIDYIQRPEVIAKATNFVKYPNGNLESQKFVDPAILNDPTIYPVPETMKHLYTTTPNSEEVQDKLTELWQKVQAGQ